MKPKTSSPTPLSVRTGRDVLRSAAALLLTIVFAAPGVQAQGDSGFSIVDPQAESFTPTSIKMSWKVMHSVGQQLPNFYRIYPSDEDGTIQGEAVAEPRQGEEWPSWPRVLWVATELDPVASYCYVLVPVFGSRTTTEGDPSPPACATTMPANGEDWAFLPPPMARVDSFWVAPNPEWRLYAAQRWAVSEDTVISYIGDIQAGSLRYVVPDGILGVMDDSWGECIGETVGGPRWRNCISNTVENSVKAVSGRGDSLDAQDRLVLGCVADSLGGFASALPPGLPTSTLKERMVEFWTKDVWRGCITTGVRDALTNPAPLTWSEWWQNLAARVFWSGLVEGAVEKSLPAAVTEGAVEFVKYVLTNPRPPEVPDEWLFWFFWLTHLSDGQIDGLTPDARTALETVLAWAQAEQCECLSWPQMTPEAVAGITEFLVEPQTRPVNAFFPDFLLTGLPAYGSPPSREVLEPVYDGWVQDLFDNHGDLYNQYIASGQIYSRHAGYFSWLFSQAVGGNVWYRCWTEPPTYDYVSCSSDIPAPPDLTLVRFAGPNLLEIEWVDRSDDEWGFKLYLDREGFSTEVHESDPAPGTGSLVEVDLPVEAGFEYCVQVAAFNGAGFSTMSSRLCDDFGDDPVVLPPDNLVATALTNNMIRLDWDQVPNANRYEVWEAGTPDALLYRTEETSVVAAGLPEGTESCFDVYSWVWPSYHSLLPATACATTFSGPPLAPSDLAVEAMGQTVAVLSWQDNSENEALWSVRIEDSESGDYETRIFPGLAAGTGRRRLRLDRLQAGGNYGFRVRAQGSDGAVSDWSLQVLGDTYPAQEPQPIVLSSSLAGHGLVDLAWEGGDGADYFELWRTYGDESYELDPDQRTIRVDAGQSSCWKIRAVNPDGFTESQHCVDGLLLPPWWVQAETLGETSVRFTWAQVDGVDSYELRDENNRLVAELNGEESTTWETTLQPSERLCLVVYSRLAGHHSGASDLVCGYPLPLAVSWLDASWQDLDQIFLTWESARPWERLGIQAFDAAGGDLIFSTVAAPGTEGWWFYRLVSTSGQVCFRVRKGNPGGYGPWREGGCLYAYPQPGPQLTAAPGACDPWVPGHDCQHLELTWTDVIEGEDRFLIDVRQGPVYTAPANSNSFTVPDLDPGYGYCVQVRAESGIDGVSEWSNEVCETTEMPVAEWAADWIVPTDWTLELDWRHPFEGDQAIAGYELWQVGLPGGDRLLETTQDTEAVVNLGELEGEEYCFAVRTLGQGADSELSEAGCYSPPTTGVVATPLTCDPATQLCERIRLTWLSHTDDHTGFIVRAWVDPPYGTSYWLDLPGELPPDQTAFEWEGLVRDWSYCFYVAALFGSEQGQWSQETERSCAVAGSPAPDLLVLAPHGGEQWTRGESKTLYWQSQLADSRVAIHLLRSGDLWRTVDGDTENDGVFVWSIPDDGDDYPEASDYQVEICGVTSALCGRSDNAFTLLAPQVPPDPLRMLEPNGGEIWQLGKSQWVQWETLPRSIDRVMLNLYDDGAFVRQLAYGLDNTGSWEWALDGSLLPSGCRYRLHVCDSDAVDPFCDESDGDFGLVESGPPQAPEDVIALAGPGEGQVQVYWRDRSSNEQRYEIAVYSSGGTLLETQTVEGLCGSGSLLWKLFSGLPIDVERCFQVRATNGDGVSDWVPSNWSFACTSAASLPAKPTAVSAQGGPGFVEVQWSDSSDNEDGFRLEVWNGSGTTRLDSVRLAADVESYRVENLGTGAVRCFRVRSFNGAGASAWAPLTTAGACAKAEEVPPLSVLSPSSGDLLRIGSTYDIEWRWAPGTTSEPVRVELLRGAFSRVLATGVEDTYPWLVDTYTWPPGATDYRIRVTGIDSRRSATSGEFTIKHPTPAAPDGVWAEGGADRVTVHWTDRSDEEYGFHIRIYSGSGQWLDTADAPSAPGQGEPQAFAATSLGMGTERCFQVQAYNSAESPWVRENWTLTCDTSYTLNVVEPAMNALWRVGEQRTIRWTRSGFGGAVQLELWRSEEADDPEGSRVGLIAAAVNDTSYLWTVENFATQLGGDYQIRATSVDEPELVAWSEPFQLREQVPATPGIIDVEGQPGQVTVRFRDRSVNEYSFQVRVYDGSGTVLGTAQVPAASGTGSVLSYAATVPAMGTERCFQVRAMNTESSPWAPSNPLQACAFSSSIQVTEPVANALWRIGQSRNIAWTRSAFTGSVRLELYRDTTLLLGEIASGLAGSSYTWTVDAFGNQVGYNDYRIKVSSVVVPSFAAWSEPFRLREQAPAAPSWLDVVGQPGAVRFRFTDNADNEYNFEVKIYSGGGTYLDTGSAPAAAGTGSVVSYSASVPGPGTERCFQVRAVNTESSAWVPSDPFIACAASSSIDLITPTAGTTWRQGQSRTISWTRQSFSGEVKVELWKGADLVQEIGRTTANSLSWTVDRYGRAWSNDYSIRVSGVAYPSVADTSGYITLRDVPPAAPSSVQAVGAYRQITVSWQDNANNETSYQMEVYQGNGTFVEQLSNLPSNSTSFVYSVSGDNVERCFRVRAHNSDPSAWVPSSTTLACATTDPPPGSPPENPANVTAYGGNGWLQVSWQHSLIDTSGFNIEENSASGVPILVHTSAPGLSFTLTVGAGQTRCFRVQAYNQYGASAYRPSSRTAVCATSLAPPAAPSPVTASGGSGFVRVTWGNVAAEDGYDVKVFTGSGTYLSQVQAGANQTSYQVNVNPSTERCFQVRAFNAAGYSAWVPSSPTLACATSDPPPGGSPPARPWNVRASGLNGGVLVEWDHDFSNTDGFSIKVFDGGGAYVATRGVGIQSSYLEPVPGSTTRCFQVEAYNGYGGSGYEPGSPTVCATSNSAFVRVDWPNGGEQLLTGQTVTVRWTRSGVDRVGVWLYKDGSYLLPISVDGCNGIDADSLVWTVPALSGRTGYQVKVEKLPDTQCGAPPPDVTDLSDGSFMICASTGCPL